MPRFPLIVFLVLLVSVNHWVVHWAVHWAMHWAMHWAAPARAAEEPAEIPGQTVPGFTDVELSRIRALGPWPLNQPADPGNEYSGLQWAEEAGRTLFNDRGLSGEGNVSCADCHQSSKGFSDARPLAKGVATHVRNTQGLLDAALQRWYGWDGGTDSLWAAAMRPLLSEIEMNNTLENLAVYLRRDEALMSTLQSNSPVHATVAALSSNEADEVLAVTAAKLIAAYVRTLSSGQTSFDRFRQSLAEGNSAGMAAYPPAAKRGLKLFLGDANCSVCHFGPGFSNGEFHDTGRPFFTAVGQVDPGRYTGIQRLRNDPYNLLGVFNGTPNPDQSRKTSSVKLVQGNWGQWRTPSLRNLLLTAPYMHDGSIATLRGVVDAYADIDPDRLHADGESIIRPLNLSDSQRNDLVVFLRSLSSTQ